MLSFEECQAVIARIYQTSLNDLEHGEVALTQRKVIGTGFLVSSSYLLTCAHVVIEALGLDSESLLVKPKTPVLIDFPKNNYFPQCRATVVIWQPKRSGTNQLAVEEDIALLELDRKLLGFEPLRWAKNSVRRGAIFETYGFPQNFDTGLMARGSIVAEIAPQNRLQLQVDSQVAIVKGFSGSPLWCEQYQAIGGMIMSAEPKGLIACAISGKILFRYLNAWEQHNFFIKLLESVDWKLVKRYFQKAYLVCQQLTHASSELPEVHNPFSAIICLSFMEARSETDPVQIFAVYLLENLQEKTVQLSQENMSLRAHIQELEIFLKEHQIDAEDINIQWKEKEAELKKKDKQIQEFQRVAEQLKKIESRLKLELEHSRNELQLKNTEIEEKNEKIKLLHNTIQQQQPVINENRPTILDEYKTLQETLVRGDWEQADLETHRILMQAIGNEILSMEVPIEIEEIENIPHEDLKKVDHLWMKYSEGKFGFRKQLSIYLELIFKSDSNYRDELFDSFLNQVGWRTDDLDPSCEGHYPSYRHFVDEEIQELEIIFRRFLDHFRACA
ncbi:GUN4 domain-containing protein [filamentous cyanobacterium LEGE 11480]|uniref:GUN4 domain-containing protein n=1 Tax=Romeriopsis navalis LEGE 11480 TaxID=2777977 RepID=A0A928VR46_9CYAN|nr:GUN4 domain-containing protein [Romeriopsis navalis]MBE9032243.1 GUN4 domain-containing protein [Romeriopsis navalis LEGE 11480]